jgi:DNA mismatch repair protein MutL
LKRRLRTSISILPPLPESPYKPLMPIRQLTETIINQIAAGEVIERPASVVKELVENALDAGARKISVVTAGGGLSLIRVVDDGSGIPESELVLALSRHCTSKLSDDLLDIRSLGFRGEALPSIGSVSRLSVRSRTVHAETAMEVSVEGGRLSGPKPCAAAIGTQVEVRDLFYNTPARLKFMKGERAETSAIGDVVRRVAIAFPHVRFELSSADRQPVTLPASHDGTLPSGQRIGDVIGAEFIGNAIMLDAAREGVRLKGLIGLPSYNRASATHQFAYVNGRPVKDKQINAAIRAAYVDAMARDRHAVAALFLELEPGQVDVNVHPAKADVRFRDPGLVRGLIIGSIREALALAGIRPATTGATAMMDAFLRPPSPASANYASRPPQNYDLSRSPYRPDGFGETAQARFDATSAPGAPIAEVNSATLLHPLGAARAQIASTYIVAETGDSLVLIDQHAAHERLVYEELKAALHDKPLSSQLLLIPEIIDLSEEDAGRLAEESELFLRFGLQLERFGPGAVAVRATPSILGQTNVSALVRDLAEELADKDSSDGLKARIDHVAATMACHGSVRAGRALKGDEMNALLRQMEAVPGSGTCNHGRPTFIELKLSDIERLFGRR